MLFKPNPDKQLMKLLEQDKWQDAVEVFKMNCHEEYVRGRFFMYLLGTDIEDLAERKRLLSILRSIIRTVEPGAYNFKGLIGLMAHAAVLDDDEEMMDLLVRFASDPSSSLSCGYAGAIGSYAFEQLKEVDFPVIKRLFEMALDIETPPSGTDLTLYCNALWVLQKDNTGLPMDKGLNERFLGKCLPHGPENPAIYFNAACLYVEMGDFDRAFECAVLARQYKYDQYDNMIEQFKTGLLFMEFRDDPRVRKIIEG